MSVSALIRIPNPFVPFSVQMLIVFIAPMVFGARAGFFGVLLYIVLGLIGLPIFTSGGGVSYFLKPSFGYLIGYLFSAAVIGIIVKKHHKLLYYILAGFVAIIITYTFGIAYLYFAINFIQGKSMELLTAVKTGGLLFIIPDFIKLTVSCAVAPPLRKIVQRSDT